MVKNIVNFFYLYIFNIYWEVMSKIEIIVQLMVEI